MSGAGHDHGSEIDDGVFEQNVDADHGKIEKTERDDLTVDLKETFSFYKLYEARESESRGDKQRREAEPVGDLIPEKIHPEKPENKRVETRKPDGSVFGSDRPDVDKLDKDNENAEEERADGSKKKLRSLFHEGSSFQNQLPEKIPRGASIMDRAG